jgi:TRAP-type C4-dicarboxylate transport system permease small subunit
MLIVKTITAWLAGRLNKIAGLCIVIMMALSCVDIIFRVMRMPFPGTYEIVGFLSALMISFAMAQTTIEKGHVAVELLMAKMPYFIQKIGYLAVNFIMAGLLALLAYETIQFGIYYKHSGELSLTLQLPAHPILYAMGGAFCISALVPVINIYMVMFGRKEIWFNWND